MFNVVGYWEVYLPFVCLPGFTKSKYLLLQISPGLEKNKKSKLNGYFCSLPWSSRCP